VCGIIALLIYDRYLIVSPSLWPDPSRNSHLHTPLLASWDLHGVPLNLPLCRTKRAENSALARENTVFRVNELIKASFLRQFIAARKIKRFHQI